MKKIIDFPRSKKILASDTFQPAPYSVIEKMTYCENTDGYWSNNTELLDDRLCELGLVDSFIEKLHEFEIAKIKQSFEFVSHGTGEIFALVEDMEGEESGRYFLNHYAFTDPLSFSCKQMDLMAFRLPNARKEYAKELAELAAEV